MMENRLSHLLSPVTINGMELKNRAVMPPMGTGYGAPDGTVTERLAAYLARRAQGGTGLIITEVCAVDPLGKGFPNEFGAYDDRFIDGLTMLADRIHGSGGKVALQLHHAGRETFKDVIGADPEAPSAIPSPILGQPCVEMSRERIAELVEAYGAAALRAQKAGFDAVEIHGAHGYLVGQFLSPFSNNREDEYGGSDENRARFALEIIKSVREKVGSAFPILIRISVEEGVRGGYELDFTKWLAPRLVEAGVDAIHASVGVYSTPGNLSIAVMDTEPGFNLFRARAMKEVVDVPVIGVGRINDPRMADKAIAEGDADLISFGRQHLTDPDFISKAEKGDFKAIRWCLACNQGCIERLMYEMKSATCVINPECGKEFRGGPGKSEKQLKAWVIGGGPAGLTAALTLLERGHKVEIFERDGEPGGQLIPAGKPPHKGPMAQWVDWALGQLNEYGVSVECGREITEDDLKNNAPDAVILAAGARPSVPPIPGLDGPNVCDARDLLTGKVDIKNSAVVLGAGFVGMEAADFLIARGCSVKVLEMQTVPPVGSHLTHGFWLNRRLKKSGGKRILGATVKQVGPDEVVYEKDGKEESITPAEMVVTALGAESNDSLKTVLEELGVPHAVVGDAVSPRRLLEAVHEGYAAALKF